MALPTIYSNSSNSELRLKLSYLRALQQVRWSGAHKLSEAEMLSAFCTSKTVSVWLPKTSQRLRVVVAPAKIQEKATILYNTITMASEWNPSALSTSQSTPISKPEADWADYHPCCMNSGLHSGSASTKKLLSTIRTEQAQFMATTESPSATCPRPSFLPRPSSLRVVLKGAISLQAIPMTSRPAL